MHGNNIMYIIMLILFIHCFHSIALPSPTKARAKDNTTYAVNQSRTVRHGLMPSREQGRRASITNSYFSLTIEIILPQTLVHGHRNGPGTFFEEYNDQANDQGHEMDKIHFYGCTSSKIVNTFIIKLCVYIFQVGSLFEKKVQVKNTLRFMSVFRYECC